MDKNETLEKLAELTARIKELPKGYISKKMIGGKIYYYHQWSENGSKQSRYIKDDEVEPLAKQIAERKELQAQVSSLKSTSAKKSKRNDVNVMKCILMHKRMLMYGKEASNRKQEIDRQHYTIPNQRPKDKHFEKI